MAQSRRKTNPAAAPQGLQKTPSGIRGLDEITLGGLPTGRPTLVCGSAGAGKTMLALEFLLRGATEFGEPGVCMMFEETAEELATNMRSLGFDLDALQAQNKIAVDYVRIERSEIHETGEYDLEALFIRLGHAVDSIGAKRIVLDTLEALFAGLPNEAILRAELRRLFRWLKERGLTAIITGERGESTLTRYGLEEYVADCVIVLEHRTDFQSATRLLRIIKYRGSAHGTNEYPFLIGPTGLSVLPITSLRLEHQASSRRISSGIPALDAMLGGQGYYCGSSVLVSGAAGTGKSSVAAVFAAAACSRGERAMVFSYEESAPQLVRNMRSIGIDLQPFMDSGLLSIVATRPTMQGLEQHLVQMHEAVLEFDPAVVVVDPISNLSFEQDERLKAALMRLIDFMKSKELTALFTNLNKETALNTASTPMGISSLMDAWLLMSNLEANGERTRTLQIVKSRGMPHSNQVREFVLSDDGVDLVDVFVLGERVVTGAARVAHQTRARGDAEVSRIDLQRAQRRQDSRREMIAARIAELQSELLDAVTENELLTLREQHRALVEAGEAAPPKPPVASRRRKAST